MKFTGIIGKSPYCRYVIKVFFGFEINADKNLDEKYYVKSVGNARGDIYL